MAIAFVLLESADPLTIAAFSLALRKLCISLKVCREVAGAARLLNRRKFDAVVTDLQLGQQCGLILDGLNLALSIRTAVTFAITSSDLDGTVTFRKGTSFVLGRPLSPESIRNTLKSYELISIKRRRYFRCPTSNPVAIVRRNTSEVHCRSVNTSDGGMAVSAIVRPNAGADLQIRFTLPDHKKRFLAKSRLCWLKTGHFGVRFVSLPAARKLELQGWLSRNLEDAIPESVARDSGRQKSSLHWSWRLRAGLRGWVHHNPSQRPRRQLVCAAGGFVGARTRCHYGAPPREITADFTTRFNIGGNICEVHMEGPGPARSAIRLCLAGGDMCDSRRPVRKRGR